jgi:hypothetical protein
LTPGQRSTVSPAKENIAKVIDRVCLLASHKTAVDWTWRCHSLKTVQVGATTSQVAPFSIAALAACNWTTSFPPLGAGAEVGWAAPEVATNASGIINQVTVSSGSSSGSGGSGGGSAVSVDTSDAFTGDGATTVFAVSHIPIKDVVSITVGGALQSRGIESYDTFPNYDVLVSYAGGTLRWNTAPASGASINISYRYVDTTTYTTTVTDAGSVATYGQTFGATVTDNSITSVQQAEDLANALLKQYADGVIEGTLVVERYGLKAGQQIGIELPILGLTGTYTIRRVTTEIDKAGTGVRATIRFGGRSMTLGRIIAGVTGSTGSASMGGGAYYAPVTAQVEGEIGIVRVNRRIEFIDSLTTYVEP